MTEKNILWPIVAVTAILGVIAWIMVFQPFKAEATYVPKAYVCHCEQPDSQSPFQCQTLYLPLPGVAAHLTQHDADYAGSCIEVEPSPSPSVSPEPSASPEPSQEPSSSPEPSVEPNPTPEIKSSDGWSAPSVRVCEEILFGPTILGYNRVSPTSIYLSWTRTDPQDDYFVSYGLTQDSLIWETYVENTHEVTLNQLPESTSIWFKVTTTDNVCRGPSSLIVDP